MCQASHIEIRHKKVDGFSHLTVHCEGCGVVLLQGLICDRLPLEWVAAVGDHLDKRQDFAALVRLAAQCRIERMEPEERFELYVDVEYCWRDVTPQERDLAWELSYEFTLPRELVELERALKGNWKIP